MQVCLIHGDWQVVLYEVCSRGEVQVPLKRLEEKQLHVQETLFGQNEVHRAHAAQTVQRLQLWDTVFSLLKLAWIIKTCEISRLEMFAHFCPLMYCNIFN